MSILPFSRFFLRTDFEKTAILIYAVIIFLGCLQWIEVFVELQNYNMSGPFVPLQNDTITNVFIQVKNLAQSRCTMNCYYSCSMYDLMITGSIEMVDALWSFCRVMNILFFCLTQKLFLLLRGLVA